MITFSDKVEQLLAGEATTKGYDGRNGQLWRLCRELPHPLGEIIYKVVRYHRQGNPDDLLKIAGWAQLMWEEATIAGPKGSTRRDSTQQTAAWAFDEGSQRCFPHFGEGNIGKPPGGREFLPGIWITEKPARGTGAGGRRGRSVGGKHRRRDGGGKHK